MHDPRVTIAMVASVTPGGGIAVVLIDMGELMTMSAGFRCVDDADGKDERNGSGNQMLTHTTSLSSWTLVLHSLSMRAITRRLGTTVPQELGLM
jgi:hypothetical protein